MINKIIPEFFEICQIRENLKPYDNYWFHGYNLNEMQQQIDHNSWNWTEYIIQYLKHIKDLFIFVHHPPCPDVLPNFFNYTHEFKMLIQSQSIEKVQNFFDLFVKQILSNGTKEGRKTNVNDTNIVTSFKDSNIQIWYAYVFQRCFYRNVGSIKTQKELKIDSLFEELEKSFDITQLFLIGKNEFGDENNKFVTQFLHKEEQETGQIDNYKSF